MVLFHFCRQQTNKLKIFSLLHMFNCSSGCKHSVEFRKHKENNIFEVHQVPVSMTTEWYICSIYSNGQMSWSPKISLAVSTNAHTASPGSFSIWNSIQCMTNTKSFELYPPTCESFSVARFSFFTCESSVRNTYHRIGGKSGCYDCIQKASEFNALFTISDSIQHV